MISKIAKISCLTSCFITAFSISQLASVNAMNVQNSPIIHDRSIINFGDQNNTLEEAIEPSERGESENSSPLPPIPPEFQHNFFNNKISTPSSTCKKTNIY